MQWQLLLALVVGGRVFCSELWLKKSLESIVQVDFSVHNLNSSIRNFRN
jgi:hypothetical protein